MAEARIHQLNEKSVAFRQTFDISFPEAKGFPSQIELPHNFPKDPKIPQTAAETRFIVNIYIVLLCHAIRNNRMSSTHRYV